MGDELRKLLKVRFDEFAALTRRPPQFGEPMELASKAPPPPGQAKYPSVFAVSLPSLRESIHRAAADLHPLMNEFWRRKKAVTLQKAAMRHWQMRRLQLEDEIIADHRHQDQLSRYFSALLFERVFLRSLLSRDKFGQLATHHDFKLKRQSQKLLVSAREAAQMRSALYGQKLIHPYQNSIQVPNDKKSIEAATLDRAQLQRSLLRFHESRVDRGLQLHCFDSKALLSQLGSFKIANYARQPSQFLAQLQKIADHFVQRGLINLLQQGRGDFDRISKSQFQNLAQLARVKPEIIGRLANEFDEFLTTAQQDQRSPGLQVPGTGACQADSQSIQHHNEPGSGAAAAQSQTPWRSQSLAHQTLASGQQAGSIPPQPPPLPRPAQDIAAEMHQAGLAMTPAKLQLAKQIIEDQKLILAAADYQHQARLLIQRDHQTYSLSDSEPPSPDLTKVAAVAAALKLKIS